MKVYVRAPYPKNRLEELRGMFDEVLYEPWTETGERYYEDEMLEHLLQVRPDVLITELDRVTEKVLAGYQGLKAIGDCRATPANLDTAACTKAGVPVLCTPGRNNQAVAELVVALIIMHMRHGLDAIQWVKDGRWVAGTTPYFTWMGNELQGKRIGLVGFGAVSQAAAKILDGFDCDVCYYDYKGRAFGHYRPLSLEELFETCDVVSLHLPVSDTTRGIVTEKLLRSMKPTALFVNAGRSALVDTQALIRVLNDKAIGGAVIDVLDNEPPAPEDLEILHCPNTIVTPHICGASYEVTNHQADILNARLQQWLAGENLEKIVYNRDVLKR
ncbi:MAG: 3-phosphoglycerate dehydrogenase [Oscillospiraceae bacterium]|nr:3-phosphoglycerate dehydrogenase [Oscillospiraceae bacterium]